MLRNLAWQATDTLTRAQLTMFHTLGDQISLTEDDRRRALNLDDRAWSAWTDFLSDGPLPAEPPLPEMLRRLGETAFNLSVVTDGRSLLADAA
ncbi:MAG: hypothetical protein QOH05_2319 [Acetobacteraceae bacterium]|jgi:hypothetical protein|nr:hypothetical protein [Acetobacteraceae bacterium]